MFCRAMFRRLIPLLLLVPLTGCIVADAAVTVVTLPVKAVGAVVDATTTSQAEADRNRGRALRKQEEAAAKAEKKRRKAEARNR